MISHKDYEIIAEKVRILHFIDTLGAGGAERQLVYLLQNLNRERFECSVVTTYDEFRHYERELRCLDVPIYSLNHGELCIVNRAKAVTRYIQHIWELRPHIVHGWLHYPNLIARISRPFCPPYCLMTAVRTQYSPREFISEKRTQWLSDFRIVINENHYLKEDSVTHRPITVTIPNGITPEFFQQNFEAEDNKLLSRDNFTLLMVARIDPRKDHKTLLEAIHLLEKKLPTQLKLILIGDVTDSNTQQQINSAISKYKLDKIIEQIPTTDHILPYYHATDISVLPSYSEGFPNVILESLATGTPVIASEAANRAELIQHDFNGWVFPTGDSQALADCLRMAWQTTDEERRLMGENGRAIAADYTIEKMVSQYEQLYDRVLKRS